MQVGLMRTLDVWLAEDHSRVENRLCQREAVGQLVEVYSRLCRNMASVRSPVMPQMLESLKVMLDRCVLCRDVVWSDIASCAGVKRWQGREGVGSSLGRAF
jgi:hypothetical protein